MTKDGVQRANYFGSLTQASTCHIGAYSGEEIYVPFKSLLPMVSRCVTHSEDELAFVSHVLCVALGGPLWWFYMLDA